MLNIRNQIAGEHCDFITRVYKTLQPLSKSNDEKFLSRERNRRAINDTVVIKIANSIIRIVPNRALVFTYRHFDTRRFHSVPDVF